MIPLSNPFIEDDDIKSVVEVLKTPTLSLGPKLHEFEKIIAEYVGAKYAVGVSSGTAGLHVALKSLGIKEEDEVITTPFSFVASTNCILYEKAKPVFVDIDEDTFNIDVSKIEEKITGKTKAILPVDIFGYPCDMKAIREIADKHGLKVLEDACEAIGVTKNLADATVFAFYPNKQLTTGEGGMVVTDDENVYKLVKSLVNQGRDLDSSQLVHKYVGYNYRIDELSCALGVSQMKKVNKILVMRENAAKLYTKLLSNVEGVKLPYEGKRSWFVYVIQLEKRDELINYLAESGITSKAYFGSPIHLQPAYDGLFEETYPVAEQISKTTVALPFFTTITEDQIKTVCDKVKEFVQRYNTVI